MNFIAIVAKFAVIVFYIAVLLLASNQHGKAREGNVNFWDYLTVITMNLLLLFFGGFFDCFFSFTE